MVASRAHARMVSGFAACLLCLFAGDASPVVAQEGAGASVLMTGTATVQTIDLESRMVTLKESDGRLLTIHVGPQVVNLPQVKPGDRVNVSRHEAMAIDVTKAAAGSVPMVMQTADIARAEPGELPAGEASIVTKVTAQVVGVSPAEHKVMFIGPAGVVRTVIVKRPQVQQLLNQLQVGDMVQISFAESEAVDVTSAWTAGSDSILMGLGNLLMLVSRGESTSCEILSGHRPWCRTASLWMKSPVMPRAC